MSNGTVFGYEWASSTAFGIDNAAPSAVGAPTFGAITTSSIIVTKPSTVTESGSGLYQWQARRDSATGLGYNATATASVTDSSLSENTRYTYDVQFADYRNSTSSYGTTATKYTLADAPTNLTSSDQGTRTITIQIDSLPTRLWHFRVSFL